jgi:hypothetical protein
MKRGKPYAFTSRAYWAIYPSNSPDAISFVVIPGVVCHAIIGTTVGPKAACMLAISANEALKGFVHSLTTLINVGVFPLNSYFTESHIRSANGLTSPHFAFSEAGDSSQSLNVNPK